MLMTHAYDRPIEQNNFSGNSEPLYKFSKNIHILGGDETRPTYKVRLAQSLVLPSINCVLT